MTEASPHSRMGYRRGIRRRRLRHRESNVGRIPSARLVFVGECLRHLVVILDATRSPRVPEGFPNVAALHGDRCERERGVERGASRCPGRAPRTRRVGGTDDDGVRQRGLRADIAPDRGAYPAADVRHDAAHRCPRVGQCGRQHCAAADRRQPWQVLATATDTSVAASTAERSVLAREAACSTWRMTMLRVDSCSTTSVVDVMTSAVTSTGSSRMSSEPPRRAEGGV